MDADEAADPNDELNRSLIRNPVVFDADANEEQQQRRTQMTPMPRAAQAVQERDAEDVWAELG